MTADFPDAATINGTVKLFWLSCGHADRYLPGVRRGIAFLNSRGVHFHWHPQSGSHDWPVWREAVYLFAQQLFKAAPRRQGAAS